MNYFPWSDNPNAIIPVTDTSYIRDEDCLEAPIGSRTRDWFQMIWVKVDDYRWLPRISEPTENLVAIFGPLNPSIRPELHPY